MKIKQTTFEYIGHGAPETATLSEVAGVVVLQTWGGENTYTFQFVTGQNGRTDVSFVNAAVNNPIEQEVISFEARGDDRETELRKVVDQLVHRLAHADVADFATCTSTYKRTIAEDSERLIAELVYKALLRAAGYGCRECDSEDWSGAPVCSTCRHVVGEIMKVREAAAGPEASP